MSELKVYRAIGLMSGTSLDGEIDVALIETDGQSYVKPLEFYAHPYDEAVRDKVRACFGKRAVDDEVKDVEGLVTGLHIQAINESGFKGDVIGFHGQTITHAPEDGFTWQIGDGAALAEGTGIPVVNDFRSADMAAGGQGAPLAPLYHQALFSGLDASVCVLNMGGVANVSYIGADGDLMAFDCGPANALMDDYMARNLEQAFDEDGALAASGEADRGVIDAFLAHPYFSKAPPKSLDRNEFEVMLEALSINHEDAHKDNMATLAVMSAVGVMAAVKHFPREPQAWFVCGGGRKNGFIMQMLADMLAPSRVAAIEEAGYNGDAIEAECFAYLAVRSILGLPLSLPSTTGVSKPQTGGVVHKA